MAKILKTTTTVTEEVTLLPETPGEAPLPSHVYRLCGLGSYHEDGNEVRKPHVSLNGKWLVEAGFHVGDRIPYAVRHDPRADQSVYVYSVLAATL